MIVVLLVSLYTTRVVLNELGVEDYGIYNVVAGFVSMFTFLNSSMTNTIQRYFNFERSKCSLDSQIKVYNTSLQIQLIFAIITLALLEIIGVWYIHNKLIVPESRIYSAMFVFQFAVVSLIILILQIPYNAAVIAHEKMDYYALVSIIDVFLKLLIVILLPLIPFDKLIFYGILTMVVSLSNFVMYYVYSHKNFPEIRINKLFDAALFKKMLSFSGWNVLSSIAYTIQGQGLNVLMNAFFGPIVNAARGVAYQVQAAINSFSENIVTAFKPQLVESYASNDYNRTIKMMFTMSKLCYLMLFVLSLPIVIEINYILSLWLGSNVPEHTQMFTTLVLINMLLGSLNVPVSQTVQAVGRIRNYQVAKVVIVTSVLPIAWFSLRMDGSAESVFYAMIFTSIIVQPISLILLRKVFEYSYTAYMRKVIFPCLIISVLSPILPFLISHIMPSSMLRLFLVVCSSVICCSLLVYLFALDKYEKEFINALLLNIKLYLIKRI